MAGAFARVYPGEMALEIRSVTDSEFDAWSDALDVGFFHPATRGQADYHRRRWATAALKTGGVIGAFDGADIVGTFQNFATPLTVPGGVSVPASGVTTVTVSPTHRRRGVLTGMMAHGLRQSADLGHAASVLIPAEWPIYGRFGYGVGTEEIDVTVDASRAALIRPLPGTVELLTAEQWCVEMAGIYERVRVASPGAVERSMERWRRESGLDLPDGKPTDKELYFALLRDESGTPRAGAQYRVTEIEVRHFRPRSRIDGGLLAESAESRARLLQFLWEHDWVTEVEIEKQPVDDTYRQLLKDARAVVQSSRSDVVWVRLLDVPAALSQRTYESEGRLVIAVEDKDSYAAGVYALEGGPHGAT